MKKQGIFVTATGTDVGKTYVSALLVKALRRRGINAGYFKPALSGAQRRGGRLIPGDGEYVCEVSGLPGPAEQYVAYLYEPSVSPHLAAKMECRPIEQETLQARFIQIQEQFEYLVAEGCGGFFCPLKTENGLLLLEDAAAITGFELLVVSRSGLGAIHEAVTTVAYCKSRGFTVAAVALNQFEPSNPIHKDNQIQIERFTGAPTFPIPRDAKEMCPEALSYCWQGTGTNN